MTENKPAADTKLTPEQASLEDDPVVAFAKWLFTLVTVVSGLAGGFQLAGFAKLRGLGDELYLLALVFAGISLASAVMVVATTLKDWEGPEEFKIQLYKRSKRRKLWLKSAAWFFAAGLSFGGTAPLVSALHREPPTLSVAYSVDHDSLTNLSATAQGHGLQPYAVSRLDVSDSKGSPLGSAQAVADTAGTLEATVELTGLVAPSGTLVLVTTWIDGADSTRTDSVSVLYHRPARSHDPGSRAPPN